MTYTYRPVPADSKGDKYAYWIDAPNGAPIANIYDRQDAEEIARKFAAVDEVIKALQDLVAADNCNYLAETMRYEGLFDNARQAIKKATVLSTEAE